MSLFQCQHCGCAENTACSAQWFIATQIQHCFDWTGIEDRKGKLLCSACGPSRYRDGKLSGYGVWHGKFERIFLPLNHFKTNNIGNLEHIKSGSTNYRQYAIPAPN